MNGASQIIAILLLLVLFIASPVAAQTGPGVGNTAAIGSYPAYLLAPPKNDGPVRVRVAFHLQNINDIDDEARTIEFTGVLSLTWHDPRQAFDPAEAQTREKFYQGGYQFDEMSPSWYPQVVLANESGMYEKHAVLLRVKPDGTSTLIETVNAVARVNLDLRRYPFDRQRLEIIFEALGLDAGEVVLEVEPERTSPAGGELPVPQWTVDRVTTSIREHVSPYAGQLGRSSAFIMTMDMHRQPFYMLRLVVIPLAMIVVLTWAVFWMDTSAMGDRLSISFIGILTAVAYQMVVSGIMPQISQVTLMNAFLNFSFFVMSASVVINLVVGIMYRQGQTQRAESIDRRCRWIFPLVYLVLVSGAVSIAFTIL